MRTRVALQIEAQAGSADDWHLAKKAFADCELDASGNIVTDQTLAEAFEKSKSIDPVFVAANPHTVR